MKNKDDDIPFNVLFSIIKKNSVIYTNRQLKDEKINIGQTPYLMHLFYNDKICQDDLAKSYKQDKSVVARGIRKLEEIELVTKEIDETNRRKSCLTLTDEGKEVAKRIIEMNEKWENELCHELNLPKKEVRKALCKLAKASAKINKELTKTED